MAELAPRLLDRIDGTGQLMLDGARQEASRWARTIAHRGCGILIEVWPDLRWRVSTNSHVKPGTVQTIKHTSIDDEAAAS